MLAEADWFFVCFYTAEQQPAADEQGGVLKIARATWILFVSVFFLAAMSPLTAQKKKAKGKQQSDSKSAPEWINELPMSKGSLFAVGMVNRYFDKKAGEEAAAEAARLELAQTIKVNVKSITSGYTGTAGGSFVSKLEKSIDEDVQTAVKNARILETWVDPEGLTYALAELPLAASVGAIQKKVVEEVKRDAESDKDSKKIEKLEVSLDDLKDPKSYVRKDKPEWVSALPEDDDAIFALGVAEGYYYYVNGREAAKDKARAELGRTIQTEIQSVLTDWYEVNTGSAGYQVDQNYLEEMTKSVSEATLSGSQIIETWYDRDPKWHYALARMTLSQLIGHVTDKAKEKVTDPKALKGLGDRLSKMINRDFLKMKNGYPAWLGKTPRDKGIFYTVGIDNGKYLSKTNGIEKAKQDARTKLAKTLSVQIEAVTTNWMESSANAIGGSTTQDKITSMTREVTDVSLEGSQIVSTFIKTDPETGSDTYYALARMYTAGMLAKIKRRAAQTLEVPEPKDDASDKSQQMLKQGREKAKAALAKLNAALDEIE